MKLLIITNYLGNKGGLGRYSNEVVKALKDFPIDIKVITEAKNTTYFLEKNILKPVFNCSKFKLILNLTSNVFQTWKISRDFDIIHAHDGWPYALYGYFATIGTKKKLFITGIGTYTVTPLRKKIIGYFLKKAYQRAKNIFCISDYVKQEISKLCPNINASVVFMGTTKLPEISSKEILEYKNKYNLEDENIYPIVLTVGDIKKRKGQLDTLKSLNLIKKEYPNFKYVMIGNSDDIYYFNQIKKFVESNNLLNNILFISNVYEDSILSFFYSICDIFMLNSNNENGHFEGFGLVLLEAAQFGKPVIGSRNCGIENALVDCYNGYLTEQGNHVEISNKVRSILKKDYQFFSQNSLEFYKRFSWNATVNKYYKSYIS